MALFVYIANAVFQIVKNHGGFRGGERHTLDPSLCSRDEHGSGLKPILTGVKQNF